MISFSVKNACFLRIRIERRKYYLFHLKSGIVVAILFDDKWLNKNFESRKVRGFLKNK